MKHALVLAMVIALVATAARAQESAQKKAGTITRQIQPAFVQRAATEGGGNAPANEMAGDKTPIYWDDVLVTGGGGRMRATLEDGSILNIGPESSLSIKGMDPRTQHSEFQLQYGRVRAQVVKMSRPDSKFEIRTNTAIITVLEGGDIYVDASSPTNTFVTCMSGEVDVWGTAISMPELNKRVVLSAGQATASGSGGNLEAHRATAEELSSAENQDAPARTGGAFGSGAFRVGGGVSAPQLIYRVEPKYPEEARKAGLHGTVVFYAVVDPDGMIRNVRVLRSLDPVLGANAMEAVRQWKFKPGMKDGKPVPVVASIEVAFRLLDRPKTGQGPSGQSVP